MTRNIVRNIYRYWTILTNIVKYYQKCLILPNIVHYGPILLNIAQYCSVLFNIVQVTISELWYCNEHPDSVQYCQIYPNIVMHWLILSSTDQYHPVAPSLDIFPLKLIPQPLQVWFRYSKNRLYASMQVCKCASMQVYKYVIKSKS